LEFKALVKEFYNREELLEELQKINKGYDWYFLETAIARGALNASLLLQNVYLIPVLDENQNSYDYLEEFEFFQRTSGKTIIEGFIESKEIGSEIRLRAENQYRLGPFLKNWYGNFKRALIDPVVFEPNIFTLSKLRCLKSSGLADDACLRDLQKSGFWDKNEFVVYLDEKTPVRPYYLPPFNIKQTFINSNSLNDLEKINLARLSDDGALKKILKNSSIIEYKGKFFFVANISQVEIMYENPIDNLILSTDIHDSYDHQRNVAFLREDIESFFAQLKKPLMLTNSSESYDGFSTVQIVAQIVKEFGTSGEYRKFLEYKETKDRPDVKTENFYINSVDHWVKERLIALMEGADIDLDISRDYSLIKKMIVKEYVLQKDKRQANNVKSKS